MKKKIKLKISEITAFVGKEGVFYFCSSIFIGLALFFVEYSFVYVLQGFLVSIEILDPVKTFLPSWYPHSPKGALIALVLFGTGRGVVYFFKNYVSGSANQAFLRHQRTKIIEGALQRPGLSSTSEIVSVFNELIASSGIVVSRVCEVITSFLCTSLLFVVGLRLAPRELFLAISVLLICLLPLRFLNNRISRMGDNSRKDWFSINEVLLVGLKNNFFLRVYGLIEDEILKGKKHLENYERHLKNYLLFASFKSSFPLIVGILIVSLTSYASLTIFKTSSMVLVAFIYIFIRLSQGASELLNLMNEISLHKGALIKLLHWPLLTETHDLDNTKEDNQKIGHFETIEINSMSFGFHPDQMIFEDFSFAVNKGDKVLIKGRSGTGKSTLVSLLLGVNEPQKGNISINGLEIKNVLKQFYSKVSYVGAEPFLIPGTIRANLLYGQKNIFADEKLLKCLEDAEILSTLNEKGMNLDSLILETAQLSTGQKQRLSIARSLLRECELLILDEATANLDVPTEEKIITNISKSHTDLTLVIISHRNTFDKFCTKVVNLS